MRVIAGTAKGTNLQSVPGDGTRPVLDRVKTPLFDILRPEIEGISVLDLFAGSGSIGIEALSQGAASCVFTDLSRVAVETIKKNLALTRLESQANVRQADAFSFLKNTKSTFDLIYVAPPQYQGLWSQAMYAIAERPQLVSPSGLVIAQIDPKEYEALNLNFFTEEQQRKYGNTTLVFYRKAKD